MTSGACKVIDGRILTAFKSMRNVRSSGVAERAHVLTLASTTDTDRQRSRNDDRTDMFTYTSWKDAGWAVVATRSVLALLQLCGFETLAINVVPIEDPVVRAQGPSGSGESTCCVAHGYREVN